MATASQLVAQVSVQGATEAKAQLTGVGAASDASGNKLRALALGGIAIAGAALVGAGVLAVKMAGDFQAGMTTLVTGAGESSKNIGVVSAGILKMAVDTGTSTQMLTAGMFQVESAGYRGKQALSVLQASAEGARVGNADLGTTANAVTTVMKDYNMSANQAGNAMNFLTAIVQNGKTTLQDLAASMSSVLPTSSAVGVHLTDVGAAMATMTGEGVPAADAATYLRQTLMSFAAPASKAQTALKDIGLSAQDVSTDMKKSLPDTLSLIMAHLNKTYKEGSPQYVAALSAIAGGSKQMQGVLDLTGTHLADFQTNMGNVSGVMAQGKGSIVGWTQVQGDFNFKMDQAKQVANTFMISLGEKLLPVATQVVGFFVSNFVPALTTLGTWLGNVAGFFQKNQTAMDALKAVLIAAGGVIAGVILPALIAWGIEQLIVAAGVIATAAPFILLGLIAAGVIFGIMELFKNWGTVMQGLQAIWGHVVQFWHDDVVKPFQDTITTLGDAFGGLGNIIGGVWSGITSAIKGAINGVISAINSFIGFIDAVQIHIPSIGVGPLHSPSFDWNGLGIPKIPLLAGGGLVTQSGLGIVGDAGPEGLLLPRGAQVIPNNQLGSAMGAGASSSSGSDRPLILQIDGRQFARVILPYIAQAVRYGVGTHGM